MRISTFHLVPVFGLAVVCTVKADQRTFTERLILTTGKDRSASVRIADLDGDDDLDAMVANGRHWPGPNYVVLDPGHADQKLQRDLGDEPSTTYATELADLDGDGDLDVAVGNDKKPNLIFLNDGTGKFGNVRQFGKVQNLRSLTLADIDGDGDIDALACCRRSLNQIYLNDGKANFSQGIPFGTGDDSTINVVTTDWNNDGALDLVLANRDREQNYVLLNDGKLKFTRSIPFGDGKDSTRAVAVGDLDGDGNADIVAGNIGQPNTIHLSDGNGGFKTTVPFGMKNSNTYCITVADMDNDSDLDVIAGNVGQRNAVFFNQGDGKSFVRVAFGGSSNATYGLDVGDLDGDGFADIAVANSGAENFVFFNRSFVNPENISSRDQDWPSFRGPGAQGVALGTAPTKWNADPDAGDAAGVLWTTEVPGLGHSSPTIKGDRIYVATAIAADGTAPLQVGRGGRPDSADDNGQQSWVVLCYDKKDGKELWRKTAHQGIPKATRHSKATHANTSVAIDGNNLIAMFGSEGLHCFDLDGNHKWTQNLGVVNISKYGIGWGYASSPAIHDGHIAIVCDDPEKPYVAVRRLSDGTEVWRSSRKDICERSWGTPLIHSDKERTQVVVNGWPWIVSYDMATGEELWRIRGGGDNPVPTPFESNGWIYITSAHGSEAPIFVVRPDAKGDVTPPEDSGTNDSVLWSVRKGGAYMSTPVVYDDYLYLGNSNGVVRCFHATTGEKVYEKRLGSDAGIIASLVAADGKIFCPSENGTVYVVKAGPKFQILAKNKMGQPCFATPAISDQTLYFRTTKRLIAIQ